MFRALTQRIGLDKATAYTSAAQIVGTGGGLLTALFLIWCLTGEEQGYYYTFKSVLAIQVFFELGMNTVITQYVAHEVPHLTWQGTRLTGDAYYLSRVASLLRFCAKWYLFFATLLLLALSVGGFLFLQHYSAEHTPVDWQGPWLILCVTTSLHLLLTPLFSYLQGLGQVKEVARYFFWKYLIYLISVIASFALGAKLYALSIGNITYVVVSLGFLLFTKFRPTLWHLVRTRVTARISYRKEVFPFQWKIALSWVSGYFIFQLFTPILYATEGALVAGQMGMTLQILTGIQALTYSWTATKVPVYSAMIEVKQYEALDFLFNRTVRQATSINLLLLVVFFGCLAGIRQFDFTLLGVHLDERFLPLLPLLLMMIPEYLNQYITAWSTYLRCHKQEPFLIYSVVTALLCALSTVGLGRAFGLLGITSGYCAITLALTPWAYHIFSTKKKLWHQKR